MVTPRALKDTPCPHFSGYIISPGGFGKTTCLATLPKPMLLVDCDGGRESLFKEEVVPVDQRRGIFVVQPTCYNDLLEIVTTTWKEKPEGSEHPYASLAYDSFSSALNKIIKPEILAMGRRERMELQDWGLYLERGLSIATKAHDLAVREDGCHTVLTFHEADKGGEDNQVGKLGPAVQGQLFDILPGLPNYVLFLRILRTGMVKDAKGYAKPVLERFLQTEADQRTPAKSRRKLEVYEPPDLGAIWDKVRPTL